MTTGKNMDVSSVNCRTARLSVSEVRNIHRFLDRIDSRGFTLEGAARKAMLNDVRVIRRIIKRSERRSR